jgi:hypothetical protein
MKVHALASEPHYARHLDAVFTHLPPELQGERRYGADAHSRELAGVRDLVLVGGEMDIERLPIQRMVYVEHGAGQAYTGIAPRFQTCYHGPSKHPESVVGYISPRQSVADSWGRPAVAVGCPVLDSIERVATARRQVGITFHFDAFKVCPEARSAKAHWVNWLHEIIQWFRDQDYDVIGHWHPRDREGPVLWHDLGVTAEHDVERFLAHSSVIVADNTSVLYEAAALDIPTIVLNAPWYRKDVDHGLRFWDAVPGPQVDHIDELLALDLDDLTESDDEAARRAAATIAAFDGPIDHKAGRRAAEWVTMLASHG